jgi:hypothetical protein
MQPADDHQRDRHQDAEPARDGHHDSQEGPEHTERKEEKRSRDFPGKMNSVWNSSGRNGYGPCYDRKLRLGWLQFDQIIPTTPDHTK